MQRNKFNMFILSLTKVSNELENVKPQGQE